MEAQAAPPPPPTDESHSEQKAGAGLRILAVLGSLVLAFAAAVAILVMIDIGGTATCEDVLAGEADFNDDNECYDGSSTTKLIVLLLGWPGAILASASVLLALGFAIRGRGGKLLLQVIAGAVVLLGLSLIIG